MTNVDPNAPESSIYDPSIVEKGPDVPCEICGRIKRKFFARDATCNDQGDRVCLALAMGRLHNVLEEILICLQQISNK